MNAFPKRRLNIGLTDAQKAARANSLGGSDANILMGGDEAAILNLWQVKTGQAESEDLSRVLPVVMGQFTEPLNIYWFEQETGRMVSHEGESRSHAEHSFMACTLDGLTTTADLLLPAVFEAKHVNAFSKIEEVEQRYMPQIHHNMAVCGVGHAVLSVFIGTMTWAFTEVALDEWYLAELIDRERSFWDAVQTKELPPFLKPVVAPVAASEWRTVSMQGNNAWASLAVDWLDNKTAAGKFDKAAEGLKKLVEADVGTASGHGIKITRAKNKALTIRAEK